jgi:hypothetical protein
MGKAHGVDIVVTKQPDESLLIEAKDEGSLEPMRVNYFIAVLGELLQKMDTSNKQYAVALPAYQQYASLINRLPLWVKQQLTSVLLSQETVRRRICRRTYCLLTEVPICL